jgi:hypothetical protein
VLVERADILGLKHGAEASIKAWRKVGKSARFGVERVARLDLFFEAIFEEFDQLVDVRHVDGNLVNPGLPIPHYRTGFKQKPNMISPCLSRIFHRKTASDEICALVAGTSATKGLGASSAERFGASPATCPSTGSGPRRVSGQTVSLSNGSGYTLRRAERKTLSKPLSSAYAST